MAKLNNSSALSSLSISNQVCCPRSDSTKKPRSRSCAQTLGTCKPPAAKTVAIFTKGRQSSKDGGASISIKLVVWLGQRKYRRKLASLLDGCSCFTVVSVKPAC